MVSKDDSEVGNIHLHNALLDLYMLGYGGTSVCLLLKQSYYTCQCITNTLFPSNI